MNFVSSNYLFLKYQKSTTSGSIDIGIRKFEFVVKTQFLEPKKAKSAGSIKTYIKGTVSVFSTGRSDLQR